MIDHLQRLERRIVFGTYSLTLNTSGVVRVIDHARGSYDVSGTAKNDDILVRIAADGYTTIRVNGVEAKIKSPGEINVYGNRGNDAIRIVRENALDVWPTMIRIYGGAGDDVITGSISAERILAGDGNDIINAGNGRDSVYGEAGDDSIRGNAHGDLLDGGDGADTLRGDDGNDNISGGANSDRLRGSNGDDLLDGGGGRDYLAGEEGADALLGGAGPDIVNGGRGNDRFDGGSADDIVEGNIDDDLGNFTGVESAARFDVKDNKLIVHQPIDDVLALIQSGRNGSTGIITSRTDAVGVATGSEILNIGPFDTAVWNGQTITGESTLVMYTWSGDADLDGDIDGEDYFQIDSNVGGSVFDYSNGDFNYDGVIDGDDYFIIDANVITSMQ